MSLLFKFVSKRLIAHYHPDHAAICLNPYSAADNIPVPAPVYDKFTVYIEMPFIHFELVG